MDGGYGTSQMPLAGAILCCTSIPPEQRTELAAIGAQMGATIKLDLTSDVSHLIVGNINSAKYRYVAKSREDVKVLAPEWLEALRTEWMEGGDVNVAALEKQYRLPAFFGLKICLTGFDNPDQRRFMQDTIVQHGAEYHGDLTKNVTHLIAATPTGKKYEHALNWRLRIVSWEWFQMSCERGLALDEDCFNPTMPVEERGKGAWDRRQSPPSMLGKHPRDVDQDLPINPLRRKLRRSASSRVGTQSDGLWAGITAAGIERKKTTEDDWTEENIDPPSAPVQIRAIALEPLDDTQAEDPAPHRPLLTASRTADGIFEGRAILTHGFDVAKTRILRDHLASNGAVVLREPEEVMDISSNDLTRGFLVVPHDLAADITALPGGAGDLSLVTNWWVEQCLHGKRLVDPSKNILCKPFDKLGISGFNGLIVNSTGFTGIELLQVTKVITLMGASYDEYLTTKTSVIVCNVSLPNEAKVKFGRNNQIPFVHSQWLWDCIRTGELQSYEGYVLFSGNKSSRPQEPRPKSQPPVSAVPTAPLSEEDSAKLRKKNLTGNKQTTKPQSRGVQNGARRLELSLSTEPTPDSTESSTHPDGTGHNLSVEEDEESIAPFDGATSQPLQDIHPSVNSPRRPSTSSNTSNPKAAADGTGKSAPARITKQPSPDSVIPAPSDPEPVVIPPQEEREQPDYTSIMTELLANRKPSVSAVDPSKRKPRRQLGRATSTRSNPSTADEVFSRASSVAEDRQRDAVSEVRRGGPAEYQPSQELGWEEPGAQEAREQMIRAMGGKIEDTAGIVRSIGVVKDVVAGEVRGVGEQRSARAGRRKRI